MAFMSPSERKKQEEAYYSNTNKVYQMSPSEYASYTKTNPSRAAVMRAANDSNVSDLLYKGELGGSLTPLGMEDVLKEYSNADSGYSYGGGGRTDLSGIFASLEQGANTQRQIAKDTYESRRADLLTSLKRFQEDNARDVQNQQRAYLSNQASLESAIAQADRQNRISAAARGLGGSGLQQLAQLQNLLSQGQTISNMATENQSVMDNLRKLLANKEEDISTEESRALQTYNNTLNEIASNLAMNKSNYEYQASEAALNRAANASNYRAAQEQANRELAGQVSQGITNEQNSLMQYLNEINFAKKSDLKKMENPYTGKAYGTDNRNKIKQLLYNAAESRVRDYLGQAGIGEGTTTSLNAINNLEKIYNNSNYLTITK